MRQTKEMPIRRELIQLSIILTASPSLHIKGKRKIRQPGESKTGPLDDESCTLIA